MGQHWSILLPRAWSVGCSSAFWAFVNLSINILRGPRCGQDFGGIVAVVLGGYSPQHRAVASPLHLGDRFDWWAPSFVPVAFHLSWLRSLFNTCCTSFFLWHWAPRLELCREPCFQTIGQTPHYPNFIPSRVFLSFASPGVHWADQPSRSFSPRCGGPGHQRCVPPHRLLSLDAPE